MNKIAKKVNKSPPSIATKNKQILDDVRARYAYEILKRLAVEDVWDNSGGTRDEYVDPNELASEMFEEALEPYIDELRKCQEMSMAEEAKLHCMGILKGIYKFEKEATTEFQDCPVDDPHDNFKHIFKEWRKRNKDPKNLEEMDEFIKKNCPTWYNDLKKSEQYLLR
jgi:hypothetical protein